MTSKPTGTSSGGSKTKFELPALDFKFGSLTDGTDIPAPLPSPVQEVPTPPKTPTSETKESKKAAKPMNDVSKAANGSSQGQEKKTNGTIAAAGIKRPADDAPLSPPPSSRQGSIRKLLSRTFLNNSYEEGEAQANGTGTGTGASNGGGRPASRSNTSIAEEKKAKRSSGWFRRLRPGSASDSASKRASTIYQEAPKPQPSKPAGPPPPMIPEFSTLGPKLDLSGDQGSLGGGDMFKNIK